MDQVGRVCAVVDAQGFTLGKRFYVRELAIRSPNHSACLLVRVQLPRRPISAREHTTLAYQTKFIHGLSLSGITKEVLSGDKSVGITLKAWHALLSSKECSLFACKNHYVTALLEKYKIPYLDLNTVYQVPSLVVLNQTYPLLKSCNNHAWTSSQVRCAQRKADQIWQSLRNLRRVSEWGSYVFQTPPQHSTLENSLNEKSSF